MPVWNDFLTWLELKLPQLLGAAIILGAGFWLSSFLSKLVRRALERAKTESGAVTFLGSIVKAGLQILVVISAAAQIGLPVTSFIAALGAAGLTIGLALKDSMTNIASGVQIIFTKPFRAGDYLALDGLEGNVDRIEMMFTVLKTYDNKEIIIPNSKVTVSTIVNYSAMESRRLDLSYTVAYEEDLARVKQVLWAVVEAEPLAFADPAPQIVVGEHCDSAVQIKVRLWCKTEDYWTLHASMQEHVKVAFDKESICIPYPQMDIHIKPAG